MIVVTGGAGFIGSHLAEKLLKLSEEILIIDNLSSGKRRNIPTGAIFKKMDIRDKGIKSVLEGANTIFHLAADPDVRSSIVDPKQSFDINMKGSFNLLDVTRELGIKHFVFASSGGTVYGDVNNIVSEDNALAPISPYGSSKAAFEKYLSSYAESYGIKSTCLRLANVIGPRSEHGVIWDFYHKLKRDSQNLKILGNGLQEKSYIDVSDVVDAFILVAKKVKNFEVFNVSNNKTLTVKQVAKVVTETMKINPTFEYTGGERGWKGDVKKIIIDSSKLRAFGWSPGKTQEDAIKDYMKYLIKNY